MCIAILNAGKTINRKKLKNCWTNNDDGAGMLFIVDGKLNAEKFPNENYMKSDSNFNLFHERYLEVMKQKDEGTPVLVHFRIATHGLTPDYLHPFMISEEVGFIHNGVIHGFGTAQKSDTSDFADLLVHINANSVEVLDNPFVEESIYQFIDTTNKLVFMDQTGDYRIFNESKGQWIGENWFSNDSHSQSVRYYGSTAVKTTNTNYATRYDWLDYESESTTANTTAPTGKLYDCKKCKALVSVTYDAECDKCGEYIESSVEDVMATMDRENFKDIW